MCLGSHLFRLQTHVECVEERLSTRARGDLYGEDACESGLGGGLAGVALELELGVTLSALASFP